MGIKSVTEIEGGTLEVELDDGKRMFVPKDLGNRHYRDIQAWEAAGNKIGEVAPRKIPKTLAQVLIDKGLISESDF